MVTRPPLILCPTSHELAVIHEAVASRGIVAEYSQCGVGPAGIRRWAARDAMASPERSPPERTVILAGLAGGLDPALKLGFAATASCIVAAGDDEANPKPRFVPPLHGDHGVVIAGVDRLIPTAREKRALHEASGAALVDMESAAFAAVAGARGWRWGVVRAVSDDAHSDIPKWIVDILHINGSVNVPALARTILGDPRRLRLLCKIGSITRGPLHAAGAEVAALLSSVHSLPPPKGGTLVFGGSFDPPHLRHAEIAVAAAKHLHCENIVIVPSATSPLKESPSSASEEDRLEMARLAFASVPGAMVDSREIDRGGVSYTVDTLRELLEERRLPREKLFLLIGADQAMAFDHWREWREIDERLATIAIVARPPNRPDDLRKQLRAKFAGLGCDGDRWARAVLPIEPVDLSSTRVREMAEAGATDALAPALHPSVLQWIRDRGLYGR